MRKYAVFAVFAVFACAAAFSAKKKNAMVRTEIAGEADILFQAGNTSLAAGEYRKAGTNFVAAHKLALSIDDVDLLSRICLSSVSFRLSAAESEFDESDFSETYLGASVDDLLSDARKYAGFSNNAKVLLSVCTIYSVRLSLVRGERDFQAYLKSLSGCEKDLSKEPSHLAHLYRTKGDVCMRSGAYSDARSNYQKACDLHTKNKVLSEIGLDWYSVARSCSLAGNKKDAISAIEKAIKYDRDAENTNGLGADYLAYAKILMKGSPTPDEKRLAKNLAEWSAKVFSAGNFERESAVSREFMESIDAP